MQPVKGCFQNNRNSKVLIREGYHNLTPQPLVHNGVCDHCSTIPRCMYRSRDIEVAVKLACECENHVGPIKSIKNQYLSYLGIFFPGLGTKRPKVILQNFHKLFGAVVAGNGTNKCHGRVV